MNTQQLSLFAAADDPRNDCGRSVPCIGCNTPVPPPHFPGIVTNAVECLACNHRHAVAALAHYAKYGRPNRTRKQPGMLFPGQQQGDGEPTAAQRAAALELLGIAHR